MKFSLKITFHLKKINFKNKNTFFRITASRMAAITSNLPSDPPKEYMDPAFVCSLKSQGSQVKQIVGDGNCLFRSIAYLI